jgi:hypothetical protein
MAAVANNFFDRIVLGEFDPPEGLYNTDQKAWLEARTRCESAFKTALLEHAGLAGHPKADRIFEAAWRMGHSYGYEDVAADLLEMAPLLRED